MLTNIGSDRVRSVRALHRRAVRDRERLFVAEGPQAVAEVVAHRPDTIRDLYFEAELRQPGVRQPGVRKPGTRKPGTRHSASRQSDDGQSGSRQAAILDQAEAYGLVLREVSHDVLVAMSDTLAPQGMVAVCRPIDVALDAVLGESPGHEERPRLLVILTNVRDPGNAGTVIRGADAAGADAVLFSDSSVDIYNPKVVRSTAGSLFHLPIVTGVPIAILLDRVRAAGLALLAADSSGEKVLGDLDGDPDDDPATRLDLNKPHAWVMGNEAWGLEPDVRAACDTVVRVPIYGKAESLNLAMAATICLYQSANVQKRSGIR